MSYGYIHDSTILHDLEKFIVDSALKSPTLNGELPLDYLILKGVAKQMVSSEVLDLASDFMYTSQPKRVPTSRSADINHTSFHSEDISSEPERRFNAKSNRAELIDSLAKITFGGQKAISAYQDLKEDFDQVTYTFIRNRDYRLVREVYFHALESEDGIGSLARKYSAGPERYRRGVVGPTSLSKAHPEILNRIRKASSGQIIKPFYVEGWWMFIRVEYMMKSEFTTEMEQLIASQLLDNWLDTICDRLLSTKGYWPNSK